MRGRIGRGSRGRGRGKGRRRGRNGRRGGMEVTNGQD